MRRPGTTGAAGLVVAVPLALLLAVAGCGGGDDPAATPSPTVATGAPAPAASPAASSPAAAAAPRVYVAVGASETAGVGADHPRTQAWPRVLHDRALPGTRLVNLGVSGATVQDSSSEFW